MKVVTIESKCIYINTTLIRICENRQCFSLQVNTTLKFVSQTLHVTVVLAEWQCNNTFNMPYTFTLSYVGCSK